MLLILRLKLEKIKIMMKQITQQIICWASLEIMFENGSDQRDAWGIRIML